MTEFGFGILLVIVGGILEGLFSLGVTRTPGWKFENIWGVGSLIALLVVPWPLAMFTVPGLFGVYSAVGAKLLIFSRQVLELCQIL